MRFTRIFTYAIVGTVLFLPLVFWGVFFWLHSSSFEYQGSQEKEFVIDAPLSEVCKRAMNARELPQTDGAQAKINVKQAAQSLAIGEPIDCEINHPEIGNMLLKIKLNLKYNDGYFLTGKTIAIEPSVIRKAGINAAEIKELRFTLGIVPRNFEKKSFSILPDSGTTVVKFSSSTDLKINFREYGFIRSAVDKAVAQSQQNVLKQIGAFIETNLLNPSTSDNKTTKNNTDLKNTRTSLFNMFPNKASNAARPSQTPPSTQKKTVNESSKTTSQTADKIQSDERDETGGEIDVSILNEEENETGGEIDVSILDEE